MPRNEELSLSSLGIQMPYNMQAEQSVLGAALMDETVLNRLITDMEPEMFYSDQNRAVYETMRSLYTESEAVDLITLVNALGNNGTFAGLRYPPGRDGPGYLQRRFLLKDRPGKVPGPPPDRSRPQHFERDILRRGCRHAAGKRRTEDL